MNEYNLCRVRRDFLVKLQALHRTEFDSGRGGENRTPDTAPPARCVTTILLPGNNFPGDILLRLMLKSKVIYGKN